MDELKAKLPRQESKIIEVGNLRIDKGQSCCWYSEERINLSRCQLRVLMTLARRPNTVTPRHVIIGEAWQGVRVGHQSLQQMLAQLRKKFSLVTQDEVIVTHHGKGVRLNIAPGA